MGAVTLPYKYLQYLDQGLDLDKNDIRELIITPDRKLVSTIYLDIPNVNDLSQSLFVLNDEDNVKQIQDNSIQKQLLQLHGVPVCKNMKFIREYILCIFQTNTILIYCSTSISAWLSPNQKQKTKFQRVSLQDPGKEVKRVQNLAIRALYALGLDYGVVKCGIGEGRKTVVVYVNPSPKLNSEMEEAFIISILQYKEQLDNLRFPLDEIVLGADPEFVMQSPKGHLLVASNYFPIKGKVGCDAIWIGQNHASKPLVEIRPEPTSDPRKLVVHIYEGLLYAAKKMSNIPSIWLAGAMPYKGFPLGGHIHFSGIQPNFKMLRALDNYLSLILIVVEDKKGRDRRPKYGFLGDFRYQPYGGFEYRTPPSWLVSPTLTKGVFAVAKIIVANYFLLRYNPLSNIELQKSYYEGDKETISEWVKILWDDLKSLKDYQVYQNYLDRFFQYILSGVTWDESKDFRKNWRIPPYLLETNKS
jgi:hypothetical protein